MKSLFKFIIYVIFFVVVLIALLPKKNLYYGLEEYLSKKDVVISEEILRDNFLIFDILSADVYIKDIFSANINKVEIKTFLLFNEVLIDGLRFSKSFSNTLPTVIDKIKINYSVKDIFNIKIDGNSSYGRVTGNINLKTKRLILYLYATKKMKEEYSVLLRKMRLKDGKYIYEYSF